MSSTTTCDVSGCVFRSNYLRIITPEYMRKLEEPCPCKSAECNATYWKEKEMYEAAIGVLRGLVGASGKTSRVKPSGE